ncbi:hypothetical protein H0H93_010989 [Arthromyces matolae]|nr:hypothetical protein H0H93_010989 [Arthromyces matolae]
MHTRRVLSHVTVAFLLVTLVSVHVTSAYPIQGQPFPHNVAIRNLDGRDDSNSPRRTGPTSEFDVHWHFPRSGVSSAAVESKFPGSVNLLVNKDGERRTSMALSAQIWGPADGATPVKSQPTWLDFEIVVFPGAKPSDDTQLAKRKGIVEKLEKTRNTLKAWVSKNDQWLREYEIRDLQTDILYGLEELTVFDIEHANHSALEGYKPAILRRMLVVIEMYENPLSWGHYKSLVQEYSKRAISNYSGFMEKTYLISWYSPSDNEFPVVIERVKADIDAEKERKKDTSTSTNTETHSS